MAVSRHVLIIEDNQSDRDAISRVLTHAFGFSSTAVGSGEEALKVLSEICPDLIVLDIGLPGISGPDTLRRIRVLPDGQGKNVSVVVLSGVTDIESAAVMAPLEVHAYLIKPLSLADLSEAISSIFPHVHAPTVFD